MFEKLVNKLHKNYFDSFFLVKLYSFARLYVGYFRKCRIQKKTLSQFSGLGVKVNKQINKLISHVYISKDFIKIKIIESY